MTIGNLDNEANEAVNRLRSKRTSKTPKQNQTALDVMATLNTLDSESKVALQPLLTALAASNDQNRAEVLASLKVELENRQGFWAKLTQDVIQPILNGEVDRSILQGLLSEYQFPEMKGDRDSDFFLDQGRSLIGQYLDLGDAGKQLSMVGTAPNLLEGSNG